MKFKDAAFSQRWIWFCVPTKENLMERIEILRYFHHPPLSTAKGLLFASIPIVNILDIELGLRRHMKEVHPNGENYMKDDSL